MSSSSVQDTTPSGNGIANHGLLATVAAATLPLVLDFNGVFARFLAVSLILHLCAFVIAVWPRAKVPFVPQTAIPVTVLPEPPAAAPEVQRNERPAQEQPAAPAQEQEKPAPATRPAAPKRASKSSARIAKKNSPRLAETRRTELARNTIEPPPRENPPPERPAEQPAARPLPPEHSVVTERPLPTLKELLPPVDYALHENSGGSNDTVSLYTTDPQYVTYMTKVRQSIESEWEYPDMALRYGLQGKLALEFVILGNGQLEGLRLVRSSGSALLDQEAMRAIKAAAPFPPIPPWVKANPLRISATMEYRDSRLDYRITR